MNSKLSSWFFGAVGVLSGIVGCLLICWFEWGFYKEVSKLPPGTEIRPMGLAFDELVVAFLTFILAVPFSVAGIYFGIKHRQRAFSVLSLVGLLFGILPLPLGAWLGRRIIAATGLILEP